MAESARRDAPFAGKLLHLPRLLRAVGREREHLHTHADGVLHGERPRTHTHTHARTHARTHADGSKRRRVKRQTVQGATSMWGVGGGEWTARGARRHFTERGQSRGGGGGEGEGGAKPRTSPATDRAAVQSACESWAVVRSARKVISPAGTCWSPVILTAATAADGTRQEGPGERGC